MRRFPMILTLVLVVMAAPGAAGANGGLPPQEPTEWDQYLLELTNRARANPDAEAARFGIDLNEGLAPGTIPSGARQPLAFHGVANRVANLHTVDILTNMTTLPPDHSGSDGRSPGRRLTDAGVVYSGYSENNSWATASAMSKAAVDQLHTLLFKDFTSSFEVPGIDPSDGTVTITVAADNFAATLAATSQVVGTKVVLRPATGEVSLP